MEHSYMWGTISSFTDEKHYFYFPYRLLCPVLRQLVKHSCLWKVHQARTCGAWFSNYLSGCICKVEKHWLIYKVPSSSMFICSGDSSPTTLSLGRDELKYLWKAWPHGKTIISYKALPSGGLYWWNVVARGRSKYTKNTNKDSQSCENKNKQSGQLLKRRSHWGLQVGWSSPRMQLGVERVLIDQPVTHS